MSRSYSAEMLELISERFKVLSEPMRLRILNVLRDGEHSVSELVEETGAGQANVSKHLSLLYRYSMVDRRKEGLHVYYRISDPAIFQLCELVCSSIETDLETQRGILRQG